MSECGFEDELKELHVWKDFVLKVQQRAEMVISASRQFKGQARSLDLALEAWDRDKVRYKDEYQERLDALRKARR